MPTSPETLSQVRNILRKLDQSIDQARGKRLQAPEPLAAGTHVVAQPAAQTLIGGGPLSAPIGGPASPASAALRGRPLASRMEGPSRLTQQPPRSGAA